MKYHTGMSHCQCGSQCIPDYRKTCETANHGSTHKAPETVLSAGLHSDPLGEITSLHRDHIAPQIFTVHRFVNGTSGQGKYIKEMKTNGAKKRERMGKGRKRGRGGTKKYNGPFGHLFFPDFQLWLNRLAQCTRC